MTATALRAVQFVGAAAAVPAPVLTNDDLSHVVETSNEWIRTRTGIRERRILPPDQTVVDLAAEASRKALARAELTPADLDLIVLATSTSSDRFGSAPQLQGVLGAPRALAFDLTAACTGFIYAVVTAAQFLQTGMYRRALVVAADVLSRTVDWSDRKTCVLFGDGAGAVVLEAAQTQGLLGTALQADGKGSDLLTLRNLTTPQSLTDNVQTGQYSCEPIFMNGREVYKFAVTAVPEVIEKALFAAGLEPAAVDGYFLHQANQRILDAIASRLALDPARVASVVDRFGNTSGASVPIALADWLESGKFEQGDTGLMAGFGAGLTWGAVAFRWGRLDS
ncbi:MAG: beta-ketoacyl-ACP synthase III [Cyanobacteria bacterium P01_E01_bin.48]